MTFLSRIKKVNLRSSVSKFQRALKQVRIRNEAV